MASQVLIILALHYLVTSAYGWIERNIANLTTKSYCGKYNFMNAAKMPYAMLQKCYNLTMHIIIIIFIIIIIIIIITIITIILWQK